MLSAIGGIFSFLSGLISWLTGASERRQGREEQALKDDQATIQQATEARQIESRDDRLSTEQLRASLLRDSSRPE